MKYFLFFSFISWFLSISVCYGQLVSLDQCAQTFSNDSIALYFNREYYLTSKECAVIKRVGRINDKSNFIGTVSDYRTNTGNLLAQFTYDSGILNGPAALYFSRGHLAAQGQFVQGKQSGDWKYWYANGQPRQVLRFPVAGPVRILAYWDSTGQQQAINGTGTWEGPTTTGLVAHGHIRLGLPNGNWVGQHKQSHLPITTELYDKGVFRRGRLIKPQADQPAAYRYSPLLTPLEPAPFLRADYMELGYTCDENHRRAQFQLIKTEFQLPSVKIGIVRYTNRLNQRLTRYRATHWYSSMPPEVTVRCSLDQKGHFINFESETSSLREVIRSLVSSLPPWQPAHYQSQPVLGYLDIILNTSTDKVRVKAAARLLSSQLPEPNLAAWP
ncbi:toxin-antitoxin system YwqK family antitoxin [uncultured Hymenobacter sp.]|uniref:toxin-antitoxin system YwqK family antitoxin n=1 Tax=uncultured Hymenobacter sp. TaxID=170016 RepID=UPI0035CABF3A